MPAILSGAGDDVQGDVAESGPDVAEEELDGEAVGEMSEAADEEEAARIGRSGGRAEAFEIDAVGQNRRRRALDERAILSAHDDDAIDAAPGGGFESAPEGELVAEVPGGFEAGELL